MRVKRSYDLACNNTAQGSGLVRRSSRSPGFSHWLPVAEVCSLMSVCVFCRPPISKAFLTGGGDGGVLSRWCGEYLWALCLFQQLLCEHWWFACWAFESTLLNKTTFYLLTFYQPALKITESSLLFFLGDGLAVDALQCIKFKDELQILHFKEVS